MVLVRSGASGQFKDVGSGGTQTLAQTLALGNESGPTDIVLTDQRSIKGSGEDPGVYYPGDDSSPGALYSPPGQPMRVGVGGTTDGQCEFHTDGMRCNGIVTAAVVPYGIVSGTAEIDFNLGISAIGGISADSVFDLVAPIGGAAHLSIIVAQSGSGGFLLDLISSESNILGAVPLGIAAVGTTLIQLYYDGDGSFYVLGAQEMYENPGLLLGTGTPFAYIEFPEGIVEPGAKLAWGNVLGGNIVPNDDGNLFVPVSGWYQLNWQISTQSLSAVDGEAMIWELGEMGGAMAKRSRTIRFSALTGQFLQCDIGVLVFLSAGTPYEVRNGSENQQGVSSRLADLFSTFSLTLVNIP